MEVLQQAQYAPHEPIQGRALIENAEGPMELLSTILGRRRSPQSYENSSSDPDSASLEVDLIAALASCQK
jgi:hypothetical protein